MSAQQSQSQNQQQHSQQQSHEDPFSNSSQFSNGVDEYRHGGPGGQLSGGGQPQTGSIDEFPPLGRIETAELGQDRRASLIQNAGFGGFVNAFGFGGGLGQPQQNRSTLLSAINGQSDPTRVLSPAGLGSGGVLYIFEKDAIAVLTSLYSIVRIKITDRSESNAERRDRRRQKCKSLGLSHLRYHN